MDRMNPTKCLTCGGPGCGDCDGLGTREAYEKKLEAWNRNFYRIFLWSLAIILVLIGAIWDITK